jgi:hypothetical protein
MANHGCPATADVIIIYKATKFGMIDFFGHGQKRARLSRISVCRWAGVFGIYPQN